MLCVTIMPIDGGPGGSVTLFLLLTDGNVQAVSRLWAMILFFCC